MRPGYVRIISGKWRSRRLRVLAGDGLRPTPDRVRETVYNWLAAHIEGSTCLDLFAGSGAFGFEALSRGADFVEMVDSSAKVVALLKDELALFQAENAHVYCAQIPKQLRRTHRVFDIVFIDPPYQKNLLLPCCFYLEAHHFLAPKAYLYLEAERLIEDNELPATWRILKKQQTGQVYYHLAYRKKEAE